MLFPWKDEYTIGIPEIDQQHKQLVGLINDLYEAMQDGSGGAVLTPILGALRHYTETHFATEERHMSRVGYPGLDEHRREHETMIDKVAELEAKHRAGGSAISTQVLLFLRNWLESHISDTDRQMAPYLEDRGAS